jgi:hypothetical protein
LKDHKEKKVILSILTYDKIKKSELDAFETIKNIFSEKYNAKFEVENLYIDLLSYEKPKKSCEIKLPGNFIEDDGFGELVGKVSFEDLYNFMNSFETITGDINLFYKSNIRLHLKNKLAEDIIDTISVNPDKFFQRNNGITILTDGIKYDNKTLILTNPDCINGCQTSSNIYKYIKESKVIPKANLCVTIIDISKLTDEDRIKITECRNKQTAIKNVGKCFIFDKRVDNIKNTLNKTVGKTLQIKKGEYSPKKIDFIDLLGICFCVIDSKPGIAKSKQESYYNSRGSDFLTKLDKDDKFLLLVYRLAEICESLRKPSNKYYASTLRYSFIAVLYILLEEAYKRNSKTKEIDYEKILQILDDKDLFDYFMTNTKIIINNYTRIVGKAVEAEYTGDYGHSNLERLSKTLDLNTANNLNSLITKWYNGEYDLNTEIINKVINIVK